MNDQIVRFTHDYLENNNTQTNMVSNNQNNQNNQNNIIRNTLPYKKTTYSRNAMNANKKNITASWDKCLKDGKCLELKYQNQIIDNNISKKKETSMLVQTKRGWRRVAWSKFKLEQGTENFNNVLIGNSNQPRCSNTNGLTISQIRELPNDSPLLDTKKLDCNGNKRNQYIEEEFMREEIEDIYIR